MITKQFVLAGKAIFTIDVPVFYQERHGIKSHYTYQVRLKKANDFYPDSYFISLLTGPDNTNDYTYLGMLRNGQVYLTSKSQYTYKSWAVTLLNRSLVHIWNNTTDKILEAGFDIHHIGKCGRCGKALTVPESIESGFGPECIKRQEF